MSSTRKSTREKKSVIKYVPDTDTKMVSELLDKTFSKTLYWNLWQYMDPELINYLYQKNITSLHPDVNLDEFNKTHWGTICFKEGGDEGGHYVYVPPPSKFNPVINDITKQSLGTYENKLLLEGDDGICHSAAMIYYNIENGILRSDNSKYELITDPRSVDDYKTNYLTILSFYKELIELDRWDRAVEVVWNTPADRKKLDWKKQKVPWSGEEKLTSHRTILAWKELTNKLDEIKNITVIPKVEDVIEKELTKRQEIAEEIKYTNPKRLSNPSLKFLFKTFNDTISRQKSKSPRRVSTKISKRKVSPRR